MSPLNRSARSILRNCLNLKSGESFLIITEESLADIGELIWAYAKRTTPNTVLMKFTHKGVNGYNLSACIHSSLLQANTTLILTPTCLYKKSFNEALKKGCRILTIQNASKALIERIFETNYKKVSNLSRKLADLFSIGKKLHLTSPTGTDLQIPISRIKGLPETGLVHAAGEITNLPAGEACLNIINEGINGKIAIDRIAGVKKKLAHPIILNINKGHVTQIKGKKEAEELRKNIRKFGKSGRKIQEFGVGTNYKVKWGDSGIEDEKVLGSVHISLGQDQATKNKMVLALKAILLDTTLIIDGKRILEDGNFLV